jgi:putative peptide zinc metalloprotease protein
VIRYPFEGHLVREHFATDSTAERRLPLRMRADLLVYPQRVGDSRRWTIKDPVALRYFQLGDEEYAILKLLDGGTSLSDIQRYMEKRFAPLKLPVARLHSYLGTLYQSGLLVSDAAGQTDSLIDRGKETARARVVAAFANPLALRFPGVAPDRFLSALYPSVRWLFGPATVVLALVLAALAVLSVFLNLPAITPRLPQMHAFFGPHNLFWLAVCLACAKILHELGHGLACKHFGCECHEIGLMLLVFTPCLYCGVSDSWTLPGKWQRVAVALSGIYVEIILATIFTFLWWITTPGLLNSVCLNFMFICSLSTIFFNGNPLLRYDGYFVLSDLVNTPNLWQRSRAAVYRLLGRVFLGRNVEAGRAVPETHPALLVGYGVASIGYRALVVLFILAAVWRLFHSWRLDFIAYMLVLTMVGSVFIVPVVRFARFLTNPRTAGSYSRPRALITTMLAAASVVAIMLIPLPYRVTAPAILDVQGGHRVFVTVPGRLVESANVGSTVEEGELLAQLDNPIVRQDVEKLVAQQRQQQRHVASLLVRRSHDPQAAAELPTAKEALIDLDNRLEMSRRDAARLTIVAPISGTILPPRRRPRPSTDSGQLELWSGLATDPTNHGCYLETGTTFCLVGNPRRMEVIASVDQEQVAWIRLDDDVLLCPRQSPLRFLRGRVAEISEIDLDTASPRLLAAGDLLGDPSTGPTRPLTTTYQIRIALDVPDADVCLGTRARVKVFVRPQSIARRLFRAVRNTLRPAS